MKVIQIHGLWNTLGAVEDQVNRLLQLVHNPHDFADRAVQATALNLYENASEFLITGELPGVAGDAIDVAVTSDSVTIRCDRKPPATIADESYRRQERWQGSWKRQLTFSNPIDPDAVRAELLNGVLTIRLPKTPSQRPRRVAVADLAQETKKNGVQAGGRHG